MPHHLARSWLVGSLMLCAVLAGCGGSSEPASAPPTTSTTAASSPVDEATATYQRYWDAYVQMSESGEIDAEAFNDVAEGAFVERDLKALRGQADAGVVRTGEPVFSDFRTTVDGDSATSLVCFDESSWGATKDGEPLPDPSDFEPSPIEATLQLRNGAWIITDMTYMESAPCP